MSGLSLASSKVNDELMGGGRERKRERERERETPRERGRKRETKMEAAVSLIV